MTKYIAKFEYVIVRALTIMMVIVLFFSTLDLGYVLVKDLISPPVLLLDIKQMLEVFGLFLLVLIGIELLETMKTYLVEGVIRVQVVFMVALIAIARKVIILDLKATPSITLVGIGIIIVSLSIGHYLIKSLYKDTASNPGEDQTQA